MAFWGASIPGNGSYTIPSQVPPRRLRITHASNFGSNSDLLRLEIKVGDNQPIPVAIGNGSTKLKLEFNEPNDVLLSVVGPTDVHLVGFYYQANQDQEYYPTKIDSKNCTGNIYLESDVEPRGGKLTKKVADMESLANIMARHHSEAIQDVNAGVQSSKRENMVDKINEAQVLGVTSADEKLSSDATVCAKRARACDLIVMGRKKQKMRKLVSEEKIQEVPTPLEPGNPRRQVKRKETKKKKTRKISGEAEETVEDSSDKCVIDGQNDEHKVMDSSDFSINAQEKEDAIIVEIARHHSEAFQDIDAGGQISERENMVDKLDETQVLAVASSDEKLSSDATVCAKRKNSYLVPAKENKQAKDKYISISREEQELDDTSKMNNDTFEALPTKVKSAKTKRNKPITSDVPNEQSKGDFPHIVLGLASSRIVPNK